MSIAGQRVLLSNEGQPVTCYGRGETDHLHKACPNRHRDVRTTTKPPASSWAQVLANGPANRCGDESDHTDIDTLSAPREQSQEHNAANPASENFPDHSPTGGTGKNLVISIEGRHASRIRTPSLPSTWPQIPPVEVEDEKM
jgi:hypothetical protein